MDIYILSIFFTDKVSGKDLIFNSFLGTFSSMEKAYEAIKKDHEERYKTPYPDQDFPFEEGINEYPHSPIVGDRNMAFKGMYNISTSTLDERVNFTISVADAYF